MFTTNMLLGVTAVTFSAVSAAHLPQDESPDVQPDASQDEYTDVQADAPPNSEKEPVPDDAEVMQLGWASVFVWQLGRYRYKPCYFRFLATGVNEKDLLKVRHSGRDVFPDPGMLGHRYLYLELWMKGLRDPNAFKPDERVEIIAPQHRHEGKKGRLLRSISPSKWKVQLDDVNFLRPIEVLEKEMRVVYPVVHHKVLSSDLVLNTTINFDDIKHSTRSIYVRSRDKDRHDNETLNLYFRDVEQAEMFQKKLQTATQKFHPGFFTGLKDVRADLPESMKNEKCPRGCTSFYLGWAHEKIHDGLIAPYYYKAVHNRKEDTFSLTNTGIHDWNRFGNSWDPHRKETVFNDNVTYGKIQQKMGQDYHTIQLKGRNKECDVTKELIFADEEQARQFMMQLQHLKGTEPWSKFFTPECPEDVQQPIAKARPGQFKPSSPNNLA